MTDAEDVSRVKLILSGEKFSLALHFQQGKPREAAQKQKRELRPGAILYKHMLPHNYLLSSPISTFP
jgi:hypothetical protein